MERDEITAAVRSLVSDPGAGDWDAVLARARDRDRRSQRRRHAVAAMLAVVLLGVPTLATATGRLPAPLSSLFADGAPGLRLEAALAAEDGRPVGELELFMPRALLVVRGHGHRVPLLVHRVRKGTLVGPHVVLLWQLSLAAGDGSFRGVLVNRPRIARAGRILATLCDPCRSGDAGRLEVRGRLATALANDRVVFALRGGDRAISGLIQLQTTRNAIRVVRPP